MTHHARPLISVIIPNYNHGRYLAEAIDSVLAQSYQPLEVIVVDNCSTDESWDVICRYKTRAVTGIRFNNDGVIAAGRNHALARAQGAFVAFLDADDTWRPDKLERQMPHFEDDAVVLVAAGSTFIGDTAYGRPAQSSVTDVVDVSADAIIRVNPIATSSVVARTAAIRDLGGFDEDRAFRFIEDWELWLRLSRRGRLRILAEPLIQYRLDATKVRDMRDVAIRKLRVIDKHATMPDIRAGTIRLARGNVCIDIGRACVDVGDWRGVRYYARGLVTSELHRKPAALAGLLLFVVPLSIRRALIHRLYGVRLALSRLRTKTDKSSRGVSG